jgi:hypothetical protein
MKKVFALLAAITMFLPDVNAQWTTSAPNVYLTTTTNSVGIGTTAPASKLDVRGNILMEMGTNPTIFTGAGGTEMNRFLNLINSPTQTSASGLKAGGILVADSYSYANPSKNDLIVKGNVGIGTATPSNIQGFGQVLDVSHASHSKIIASASGQSYRVGLYCDPTASTGTAIGTETNHKLNFIVNYSTRMTLDTNGRLGIGTANPDQLLTVNGIIHAKEVPVCLPEGARPLMEASLRHTIRPVTL